MRQETLFHRDFVVIIVVIVDVVVVAVVYFVFYSISDHLFYLHKDKPTYTCIYLHTTVYVNIEQKHALYAYPI